VTSILTSQLIVKIGFVLQKKVNYLITIVSMGTANFNTILGSHNCVFEKVGIGYQCGFQGKQKKFSSLFKAMNNNFHLSWLVSIVWEKVILLGL